MSAVAEQTDKIICPHCQGEFDKKRRGPFNLHVYHCEVKQLKKKQAGTAATAAPKTKKLEECTHTWRVLNKQDGREAQAINGGYLEVCNKCLDLR